MITLNVKRCIQEAIGMTQASQIGVREAVIADVSSRTQLFTRTLAGSLTKDYLFAVGSGDLDPEAYVRLMMQYSNDTGIWMGVLVDEFRAYAQRMAFDTTVWMKVVATIMGPNVKTVSQRSMTKVTPTIVLNIVRKELPSDHEPFVLLATDYICSMLGSLGWILTDAPYNYRVRRGQIFPRYRDLVDCVEAHDLKRMFVVLANADLSIIKEAIDDKKGLNPGMVAQQLSSAVSIAYDTASGRYSSEAIVSSVLATLGRLWTPDLPKNAEPAARIQQATGIEELKANFALFLAYQNMQKTQPDYAVEFSDEEMTTQVIPTFLDSIVNSGIFKTRLIKEVVDHVGIDFSANHMGQPGKIVVYESLDASDQLTAFIPVRQDQNGNRRFLSVDTAVSDRLTTAMKPVSQAFSLESLVDQMLTTTELNLASERVPTAGAEMYVMLPSFYERELSSGRTSDQLLRSLKGQVVEAKEGEDKEAIATAMDKATYDVYAFMAHLAVVNATATGIAAVEGSRSKANAKLVAVWDVNTKLYQPVGQSAIIGGSVRSTEPVEVISYCARTRPASTLKATGINLADHQNTVHVWNWHDASENLSYVQEYVTVIRNKTYTATVEDHQLLATSALRTRLRFMKPTYPAANAELWFAGFLQEWSFVSDQIANAKDDLVRRAFEGRQLQNAIALVSRLVKVANGGIANRAEQIIKNTLQDAMYGDDRVDDYAEVHVGIQQLKIKVWAGLITLEMLQLITPEQVVEFNNYINNTNALSLSVGVIDYDKRAE